MTWFRKRTRGDVQQALVDLQSAAHSLLASRDRRGFFGTPEAKALSRYHEALRSTLFALYEVGRLRSEMSSERVLGVLDELFRALDEPGQARAASALIRESLERQEVLAVIEDVHAAMHAFDHPPPTRGGFQP